MPKIIKHGKYPSSKKYIGRCPACGMVAEYRRSEVSIVQTSAMCPECNCVVDVFPNRYPLGDKFMRWLNAAFPWRRPIEGAGNGKQV